MIRTIICINSVFAALLAATLLVYPSVRAALDLRDPALQGPGIARVVWRMERHLTPRYAAWAQERVAHGQAAKLSTANISGTEWPLFGSVFYLWAIENLQNAWDSGDHAAGVEPKIFCHDAIVAASDLVVDPGQAAWVQKHWGTNYLHQQNVFYRMLVIAALTSRARLLHDNAHLALLRDQVESLSTELNEAKSGLLNDYPSQCYPGDVMAAIACIQRADSVLGADHSKFVKRSVRAFSDPKNLPVKLPPYQAAATTGAPLSEARGCANSYMCLTAPELWPVEAKTWFQFYEKSFWQQRLGFWGFREFPSGGSNTDWTIDVDAGPVIDGFGVAANAFGVGAARRNGRFDRAYPLSAEMLATVWEMPNGMLALPRVLSDLSDAPMLGEAAIFWLLSVQPEPGFRIKTGGSIPMFAYILIVGALIVGLWRIVAAVETFSAAIVEQEAVVRAPRLQAFLWTALMLGAIAASCFGYGLLGLALLLAALLLPRIKKTASGQNAAPVEKGWF